MFLPKHAIIGPRSGALRQDLVRWPVDSCLEYLNQAVFDPLKDDSCLQAEI